MSRRTRYICWLILANIACLAVGLLMQYYSTTSSARRVATEQAWTEMEADAGLWLTRLRFSPGALPAVPARNAVLLADPQWRLLKQHAGPDSASALSQALNSPIQWQPADGTPDRVSGSMRGMLFTPDGQHAAIACRLDSGDGFLVVHKPQAAIEAESALLLRTLPVINLMTLIWTCVPMSIAVYMLLARMYGQITSERLRSGADVLRQAQTLVRTRDAIIFGLAKLAESRDSETGAHLERISAYSTALASALRRHPKFHDQITPAFLRLIGISSALHDIGKVGIEDSILLRPGPLNDSQRERMHVHTTIGGQCLHEIEQRLGNSNFLHMAREIAFAHHEHWDGTGYPRGLAGEAIPLAARVVALADEYDALSSRRVYKDAFSLDQCAALIRDEAGQHLDPDIVAVWVTIEPKFREIARQYGTAAPEYVDQAGGEQDHPQPVEVEPDELLAAAVNLVGEEVLL